MIQRQKRVQQIQKILNWNEYHPIKVDCKWSRWHKVYETKLTSDSDDPHNIYLARKPIANLHKIGFIVAGFSHTIEHPGIWSSANNYKLSECHLVVKMWIMEADEYSVNNPPDYWF